MLHVASFHIAKYVTSPILHCDTSQFHTQIRIWIIHWISVEIWQNGTPHSSIASCGWPITLKFLMNDLWFTVRKNRTKFHPKFANENSHLILRNHDWGIYSNQPNHCQNKISLSQHPPPPLHTLGMFTTWPCLCQLITVFTLNRAMGTLSNPY